MVINRIVNNDNQGSTWLMTIMFNYMGIIREWDKQFDLMRDAIWFITPITMFNVSPANIVIWWEVFSQTCEKISEKTCQLPLGSTDDSDDVILTWSLSSLSLDLKFVIVIPVTFWATLYHYTHVFQSLYNTEREMRQVALGQGAGHQSESDKYGS